MDSNVKAVADNQAIENFVAKNTKETHLLDKNLNKKLAELLGENISQKVLENLNNDAVTLLKIDVPRAYKHDFLIVRPKNSNDSLKPAELEKVLNKDLDNKALKAETIEANIKGKSFILLTKPSLVGEEHSKTVEKAKDLFTSLSQPIMF